MKLLLQFIDLEFDQLRWSLLGDQSSASLVWQSASTAGLATIVADHPHPVTILIPQQWVYLTEVSLPEKANRQLLSAIEFQVEDRLAQDIDTLHFAIGDSQQNPIAIAVVAKSVMQQCISIVRSHGLRLQQIIPELFLCPWREGDAVNLIEVADGWLLRYGDFHGLKCDSATLPLTLDMVGRDAEFESVCCFVPEASQQPEFQIEKYEVQFESFTTEKVGFLNAGVIELQQREFKLSSPWLKLARAWRWVLVVWFILLTVSGFNKAIALHQLEGEVRSIKQQQYELIKPFFGASLQPEDNLKKQLINRLKQQRVEQGDSSFIKLLLEFSSARSQFAAVNIDRISYQDNRLNIDLTSKQLKDIEALHAAVQEQVDQVSLENLSIKPDLISGRLVLRGAVDE